MTLDARSRSSIYRKLVPILGEHDANALMSELATSDDLVTVPVLRAELAQLETRLTLRLVAAIAASTTLVLAAIGLLA